MSDLSMALSIIMYYHLTSSQLEFQQFLNDGRNCIHVELKMSKCKIERFCRVSLTSLLLDTCADRSSAQIRVIFEVQHSLDHAFRAKLILNLG